MVFHRKALKKYRYVLIKIIPFLQQRLTKPPDKEVINLVRRELRNCYAVAKMNRQHFGSIFRNAGLD